MWTILISCICIVALFFLIVMLIDGNRFVVRTYQISSEKIAKPRRVLLVSDLHNKSYGKNNDRVFEKIEELKPDFALIGGDLVTASPGEKADVALQFVQRLSGMCPVYYGLGNHEYRLRLYPEKYCIHGYEQKLKKMGIHLLDNGRIAVDDDIEIAGFSIERYYYRRLAKHEMTSEYPKQKLGSCNEKRFQIMIAHNPEYFEAYAGWGADLTVSGHVHGGVMRLPFLGGVISPRLTLFPKYDGGMFEQNGRFMVVSRGLGTHTLPIRIFNPGELIMIELNPVGHMQ